MSESTKFDTAAWRQRLNAQRKGVDDSIEKVVSLSDAQLKKSRDAEARRETSRQRQAEVIERSAAICHDMLLMRAQDEWSLAFGFLVNHTLGHLSLAYASADDRILKAMVTNLSRLADETAKAFPDRRMAVDPWQRAIAALGEPAEPAYESKPHPHVESLSRLVLTLRDTGPGLKDFRAYYAPFGATLHIIRPA
jgi:hypothetical protein